RVPCPHVLGWGCLLDPATWTVWLGCDRAPEGKLVPSSDSPFIPFAPPSHLFLPAIKNIPPVSRRRRRYLTGFGRGCRGGYSLPCIGGIRSSKRDSPASLQKTSFCQRYLKYF